MLISFNKNDKELYNLFRMMSHLSLNKNIPMIDLPNKEN